MGAAKSFFIAIIGCLWSLLSGCTDSQPSVADPGALVCPDFAPAVPADVSVPADVDTAADAMPPAPELPLCDRVCDRIVDCGVEACEGYDWASSGVLFGDCWELCQTDGAFASEVEGAGECEEALGALSPRMPDFDTSCAENLCATACDFLGPCAAEICPALSEAQGAQLALDCRSWCNPEIAANVLYFQTCAGLIDALVTNDPNWADLCYGTTHECPAPAVCVPYADKATGCFLEHCPPEADGYQDGFHQVVVAWCTEGDDCPRSSDIEPLLAPAVTCDTPPFTQLGPAPPFDTLCLGTTGVTAGQVHTACSALLTCPGTEWLPSVDYCMVLLAMRPDAAALTSCLNGAGSCIERFACLEAAG